MSIPARKIEITPSIAPNRRVLIVTDDVDGSVAMVDHLQELGLHVQIAAYDGAKITSLPHKAPAATLCFLTDYVEHGAALVSDLRCRYADTEFPILGRLTRESASGHPFDSVLFAPVHPAQVAKRLSSLIRLGQMEREIVRRVDTLRETFGIDHRLDDMSLRRPFRILFIGRAGPTYLSISSAMRSRNAEMIAAFTSFSAFDYLHDGDFDAVVMNAVDSSEPALTIADTMRRNAKLFHVPVLLLTGPEEDSSLRSAFGRGVDDFIDSDASELEIGGRIMELANAYRLHERLKSEFSGLTVEDCVDRRSGVFNARFLSAHLKRVSRDCRKRDVPLSILTIKLMPQSLSAVPGGEISRSLDQAVTMIASIVRMQDIVARIDDTTVVIAFPEERREEAELIAARITGFIEDASFQTVGNASAALTLSVDTAIVEQARVDAQIRDVTKPSVSIVS